MKRYLSVLVGLLMVGHVVAAHAGEAVSVRALPLVVVKTVPAAGDIMWTPRSAKSISKDMMTKQMWSWVIHTRGSFPDVAGDVRYLADRRTNVLPMKLQPGRTYALWINSPNGKHSAFRDRDNNPAMPYLLAFETRK